MDETRTRRIFEMLHYYSDTFARLPLSKLEDVEKTAVKVISSILDYRITALLALDDNQEATLVASRGIDQDLVALWDPKESALLRYLCRDVDAPTVVKCGTLAEHMRSAAQQLRLGEMFLVAPLKGAIDYRENRIGLAVAAQPRRDVEPEIDIKIFETIAGLFTGAITSCIMRKRMQVSEKRFQEVVQDQTELVYRWKPDGTRTFVNQSYCRAYGKTQEELVGTKLYAELPPEDQEQIRRKIGALTPENPIATDEHLWRSPLGKDVWEEWRDRAVFGEDGQIVELQSVGRVRRVLRMALRLPRSSL